MLISEKTKKKSLMLGRKKEWEPGRVHFCSNRVTTRNRRQAPDIRTCTVVPVLMLS
jgi:hypothetical protein